MVGAKSAIASRVGVAVVDGHEIRAADDDRGQPRKIVNDKVKYLILPESIEFCKYRTVKTFHNMGRGGAH